MGTARLIVITAGTILLVVFVAAALSACATVPATSNLCSVGPFIPDAGYEHRLTDAEKMQAIVWNESGADICGWTTE